MPSFEAVNYALRPNKTVERKIVFSGLEALSRIVGLSSHRYVGFGSLWFVDYLMAHKILGVSSMTSIESDAIGFKRAEFNRPLNCITVVRGESTLVIPTLGLDVTPSIVWLDYDTSIGGPAMRDIDLLVSKCAANSVLIVTINAKKAELETKDENGIDIGLEASLRRIAGDLVPTPLSPKKLNSNNYPKLLCEILANQLLSRTLSCGRPDTFVKLFDLAYTDGTPMATVGGVLSAPDVVGEIRDLVATKGWQGIADELISIPPLTPKEKIAMDQMMPSAEPPTVQQVHKIGFALKAEQIETYHRYYRHYPMFGEFV